MVLDKKTAKLLNIISSSSNGEYKVLELVDILSRLPKKYSSMTVEEITNMFNYLKDLGYVDIKYFDENEVCYAILPKSRLYEENLINEKKLNRKFALVLAISGVVSGICSFFGAMVSLMLFG